MKFFVKENRFKRKRESTFFDRVGYKVPPVSSKGELLSVIVGVTFLSVVSCNNELMSMQLPVATLEGRKPEVVLAPRLLTSGLFEKSNRRKFEN